MLTTPQVAERLGVSTARVRQLILAGRLPSQQFGRDHVIKESDLALVTERKTGRPAKKQAAAEGEARTATDAPDDAMPAGLAGKPTKKLGKKSAKK